MRYILLLADFSDMKSEALTTVLAAYVNDKIWNNIYLWFI